jgi:hypothetical protein
MTKRSRTSTYDLHMAELDEVSTPILKAALPQMVSVATKHVRSNTPVGPTGNLRKGVVGFVDSPKRAGVMDTMPHAHLIISGVQPHEVVLEKKRAMRFRAGGELIVRKAVKHHPGIQNPNPFLSDAVEAHRTEIVAVLKDIV